MRSPTLLLALAALAASTPARAQSTAADPWFGRDKALHFGVSAALAAAGYGAGALVFRGRGARLVTGGGLALTLGVAKELNDLAGNGDPSWRDLTWDVVGTAVGLLVAWGADRLLFGDQPRVAFDAGGFGLLLRF